MHSLLGDEEGTVPATDRKLQVNAQQWGFYAAVAAGRQRPSVLGLPIHDPCSRAALVFSGLNIFTDLTYTAFFVPLSVAFAYATFASWLGVIDMAGNLVYASDLYSGFTTGFIALWDGRWVTVRDARLVAWYNIRHGSFLINVIALLPLVVQVVLIASGNTDPQVLHLVYMLRLLRLTRVIALLQGLSDPANRGTLSRWLQGALPVSSRLLGNAFYTLAVLLNLLGCLWVAIAKWEGLDNSWMVNVSAKNTELPSANDGVQYLYSVYYVMTTITTIGYGDVTPYTNAEVGVALIYMLIGVGYFGYIINLVSTLIAAAGPVKRAAALEDRLRVLDGWIIARQMPTKLARRMRAYYVAHWLQETDMEEAELYAGLPADLKLAVKQLLQTTALSTEDLLPGLSKEAHGNLKAVVNALATPLSLYPGQVLYTRREDAHYFYILDDGTMAARSSSSWPAAAFSGPCTLGLLHLFGSTVPEAAAYQQTLTAVSGCHLWRVDCAEAARRLLERHPEALQEVAKLLIKRLRQVVDNSALVPMVPGGQAAVAGTDPTQRALWRVQKVEEGLHGCIVQLAAVAEEHRLQRQAVEESASKRAAEAARQGGTAAAAGPGGAAAATAHEDGVGAVRSSSADLEGQLPPHMLRGSGDSAEPAPQPHALMAAQASVQRSGDSMAIQMAGLQSLKSFQLSAAARQMVQELQLYNVLLPEGKD